MTAAEFMRHVEELYGKYQVDAQLESVAQYLARFGGDYLDALLAATVTSVPWEYKSPPSIATLEKLKEGVLAGMRLTALWLEGEEQRRMIAEAKAAGEVEIKPGEIMAIIERLAAAKRSSGGQRHGNKRA